MAILLIATMAMGIAACGGSGDKKTIIQLQYGVGTKHLIFCNGRSCKNLSRRSSRCEN